MNFKIQSLKITTSQLKTAIQQNHTMMVQMGWAKTLEEMNAKRDPILKHLEHAQNIMKTLQERQEVLIQLIQQAAQQ